MNPAGPGGRHDGLRKEGIHIQDTLMIGAGQPATDGGRRSRQSSDAQLGLLQQALKSREDAISGARWCLGCGKRFLDVFKLAQHIKDRHDGVNGPGGEAQEVRGLGGGGVGPGSVGRSEGARGGREARAVSIGDYLGTVGGGTGGGLRASTRKGQKAGGVGPRGEQQRHQGLSRKEPRGGERKKALSSLKKKYVREKRNALREAWEGVRVSLEENIGLVEAFVEEMGCEKDRNGGMGVDWWSLEGQVRWYRGYLAARFLEELRAMLVLCVEKLKTLEGRVEGGGVKERRNGERGRGTGHEVGAEEEGRQVVGERGTGEEEKRDQVQIQQQQYVEGEGGGRASAGHAVEDGGGLYVQHVEGPNDEAVYDLSEDDDSDSLESDDSFDLQWGDTLQTWAHSLGHASLKSLSRAQEETLVHHQDAPVVLDVEVPASKGRGRKHDGAGVQGAVTELVRGEDESRHREVRVVINAKEAGQGADADTAPFNVAPMAGLPSEAPVVPWYDEFRAFNTTTAPIYCPVCHDRRVFAWDEHLASPEHGRRLATLVRQHGGDLPASMKFTPLTKSHNLSVEPKRYVGEAADVGPYVTHVITEDLNAKVIALLSKLISWQARTKEMDPMNAKRKKRLLSGMREAGKAVRLGKVRGLVVAPNVQPLSCAGQADSHKDGDEDVAEGVCEDGDPVVVEKGASKATAPSGYPTDGILEAARAHGVPVVFALTRRKMGKLLGQKKTVSVFALLNVQGAEREFDQVFADPDIR